MRRSWFFAAHTRNPRRRGGDLGGSISVDDMNAFSAEGASAMLKAIQRAHLRFIASADTRAAFEALLSSLLELSGSEFGLIGEVVDEGAGDDGARAPRLRAHAITDLGWDARTRALHEGRLPLDAEARGLYAVVAQVLATRAPVVINDPDDDARLAEQVPACTSRALMGLPLVFGGELVGAAIAADRPGGYSMELCGQLELYCSTCAHLIIAYRENIRRQRAEAALRESEARFRVVADAAPVLIWMSAVDGGCCFFNEVWLRFRGRTLEEESGRGWLDGVHPHDRARCTTIYAAALETRAPFSLECRLLRHDGEYRWLLDRAVPRYDASGLFAGYIGACTDVTEIKAAEAALAESQAQFAGVIDTALDAIITVDERQCIRVFNSAAERIFGYRAGDIVGAPLDRLLPERFRAIHRSHVDVFKSAGERTAAMGAARELCAVRANGEEFPIEASISRCRVGGRMLLTVIVRDVTKLRELAAAREAQAAAEAANQAKTIFLSRISHELRTPLNAVLGFAQLLEIDRHDTLTARQHGHVEHIMHAGQHLLGMISELLDLTRIESGQMKVECDQVSICGVVRSSVHLVEKLAADHEVVLECEPDDRSRIIATADAMRLTQVLVNLLTNAVKYNRRGGSVRIRLVFPESGRVGVEVRDTGIGMDAEQLAHLFEAFNRLGRERSHVEGAGIGLSLAKRLTELMGGEITVSSEVGRGSVFTVMLRRTDVDS